MINLRQTAVAKFFRNDYFESRALVQKIAAGKARVTSYPIEAKSRNGDDLYITIITIGPKHPRKVLAIMSGTHGLEGPVGGAIQAQFLAEDLGKLEMPEDMGIVLVHGINPFGWSWSRRQNEDNIDLNRNFVDFKNIPETSEDYANLDHVINPTEMSDTIMQNLFFHAQSLVEKHGFNWVQRVISEGQYAFPRGMNYGGVVPSQANVLLRENFTDYLARCEEGLIIDVHSGLGDYGKGTILSGEISGSFSHNWIQNAYAGFGVETLYGLQTSSAPATKGKLAKALSVYAKGPNVRSFTLEFGTYEPTRVFLANVRENWLHHYGDRCSVFAQDIVREARQVFNPDDDIWRASVLAEGRACIDAGFRALVQQPCISH